jgi:hypothetical protein
LKEEKLSKEKVQEELAESIKKIEEKDKLIEMKDRKFTTLMQEKTNLEDSLLRDKKTAK